MDELEQLASLLGNTEKQRLERIENRLNDGFSRIQDTAEVLPAALHTLSEHPELVEALQAPVETCVQQSMQQQPQRFAKALMPVMGPLLRKISEETNKPLKDSVQTLGEQLSDLEQSVNRIEDAYANQHLQLSQLTKQIEELQRIEIQQFKQLHQILQSHQNELNSQENSIKNIEKAQINQHLQLDQVDEHLKTLKKTHIHQLIKRSEFFKKVSVRFSQLEKRFNTPNLRAKEMAEVLPDAIRFSSQQALSDAMSEGLELTQSLQTPVEHCIKHSISHDVRPFADALFPIMGPAIRKSINETFKTILQRVNKTLEESFSPQGLALRMQAVTKGVSFSELVLQNTLIYRVEQVF
jgi:adenylate kinase family enzyme